MKGYVLFESIWTVVAFVTFIGIVIWAWSKRRKKDFDDTAKLALDDDKVDENEHPPEEQTSKEHVSKQHISK